MADDIWTSQTPLSNDQFRQLLETPLSKRQQSADLHRGARARAERKKRREEAAEHHEEFTKVIKEESGSSDNEQVESDEDPNDDRPLYRDRARERREGKQPDSTTMDVEMSEKTIEDTKFLGGDLEHTHLVKGLDYALLNKERAKIEKAEIEKEKRKLVEEKVKKESKGFTFSTPTGRAVYNALFKPTKVDVKEFFKPGRTAFVYDFEDEFRLDLRPNVLRRPKSECLDSKNYILADMDSNVVEMLAKIMSYIKTSGSGKQDKKLRKKEKRMMLESMLPKPNKEKLMKQEESMKATVTQVADADDDIFADAGSDYICDTAKRKKQSTPAKPFSNKAPRIPGKAETPTIALQDLIEEGEIEISASEESRSRRKESGLSGKNKKERKDAAKEIDPSILPDHYAECYPGFHQSYAGVIVDSDEEDLNQTDNKTKQTSRHDFETEEEWSKYKQKTERSQKGASQHGGKTPGGRKMQSKVAEKHRKEQKLGSQLTKIEKIFKDQGHGHGSAFRSDSKADSKKDELLQSFPAPKNRKRIRLDQKDQS